VSLTVPAGQVQLVVGPNGCGKSTLARLAVGLLKPSRGAVRVDGLDPRTSPAARRLVGFVGHGSLLYDDLTPVENLEFAGRLYRLADAPAAAALALERFALAPERHVPLRRLSRGMVQRVALARALLHQPRLLVLDEPFTGLDAPSAGALVDVLDECRTEGVAVLIVSHELTDVWRLPAAVAVLADGVVRFDADTTTSLPAFRERYAAVLRG
jgi:heme exporter protein A